MTQKRYVSKTDYNVQKLVEALADYYKATESHEKAKRSYYNSFESEEAEKALDWVYASYDLIQRQLRVVEKKLDVIKTHETRRGTAKFCPDWEKEILK
jgi:hypothetical protein